MTHDLQISPDEFRDVLNGERAVFRPNQNFGIGDLLCLREFIDGRPSQYTGRTLTVEVLGVQHVGESVNMSIGDPLPDKI